MESKIYWTLEPGGSRSTFLASKCMKSPNLYEVKNLLYSWVFVVKIHIFSCTKCVKIPNQLSTLWSPNLEAGGSRSTFSCIQVCEKSKSTAFMKSKIYWSPEARGSRSTFLGSCEKPKSTASMKSKICCTLEIYGSRSTFSCIQMCERPKSTASMESKICCTFEAGWSRSIFTNSVRRRT